MTFEESVVRVAALREAEVEVNPFCSYGLMSHGHQVERAIVLIHGFTSCPQCFHRLGEQLHALGHNILLPRLPRHGLADRLNNEMAGLNADELVAAAEEAMDIATGLGQLVTVAGLSLGGVLAAKLALDRADLDRAVIIAPIFAAPDLPEVASALTGLIANGLPNRFVWWDAKAKEKIEGPAYAYPRFPTKGYGAMLTVGARVKRAARAAKPRAREIRVVINAADPAVNNDATRRLVEHWRSNGEAVSNYEFPKELNLLHDMVSPEQTKQQIDLVYPVLKKWIADDLI